MAFDTPGLNNKLGPRPAISRWTPGSTDITPVNHQSSTTPPVGWHGAASGKHFKCGSISRPAGHSSSEEHDGDMTPWQFGGSGDGMPSSGSKPASRRVCHVCGNQVMPRLHCPSCGHPICIRGGPEGMSASGSREEKGDADEVTRFEQMSSVVSSLLSSSPADRFS